MVDTLDTSRCLLIIPIRSMGAGLCNWEFRRGSHCDVVFAATGVAATIPGQALRITPCKFVAFSAARLMV
jgi:phage-related protein